MQFSDTSNKTGLVQYCEQLTGLGDGTISGNTTLLKQTTLLLNNTYHKMVTMFLQYADEWDFDDANNTDYPIATTNLVANQQDYTFPLAMGPSGGAENILAIKRVEVCLDGSNWYKAEPFDINERGLSTSASSIAGTFNKNQPFYDVQSNAIFLYPIPDTAVSAGLKVWFKRDISEFVSTDTTKVPGFETTWHPMLSIGAALEYCIMHDQARANGLQAMWNDWELRFRKHKKNEDRNYVLKSNFVDYS